MKMLGIYNSTNKRFRKDGDEFAREALEWAKAQSIEAHTKWSSKPGARIVDVRDGKIRAEIREMTSGLDVLAIFDHGTPKGLPRMRESLGNVKGLAQTIAGVTDKITIILYSCSCGRGWWGKFGFRWMNKRNKKNAVVSIGGYSPRDGYAIALTCELIKLGVDAKVFAHLTRGHTARNPHVVGVSDIGGWRVWRTRSAVPGTPEWKQWKRDMKGPLRFTFWR